MRKVHALLGVLALMTGASARAVDPPADEPETMHIGQPADERVTIPISIGGAGPWPFVIDTGAERTVISRDLADRLALARGETVTVLGMAGSAIADTVTLPQIGYGRSKVDDIEAPVLEAAHLGAAGLLGLDGLQSKRLLLDFRSGRMTITSSRNVALNGEAIVVEARRRKGQLILLDSDIDGMAVNIVLDTGTNISVGNMALLERLAAKKQVSQLAPASITSVTGSTLEGPAGIVDEVHMGRVTLSRLGVLFADAAPFTELGLQDKPALLLGINALRIFDRVAIDFGKARVDFLLPDLGAIERARFAATGGAG
jgi:predicted aspartyl protease